MHPDIKELVRLLPPPTEPRNNLGDWSQVEKQIGTRLPTDFMEFTGLYGSVKICDYLWINTPFGFREDYGAILRSLSNEYDGVVGGRDNIPYPEFPTPGGLLAIGMTDNADVISWITEGEPDEWGIFFWHWPGLSVHAFPKTCLAGFLVRVMRMDPTLFPHVLPETFFSPDQRGLFVIG